jgi:N-acetylglucosaminyldiphosphoundecaprenol N-acetyl-beta-D-mannosaminyltransferase
MTDPELVYILSVPFHNVSFDDMIGWATDRMARRIPGGIVVTPNLDFMCAVAHDKDLRRLVFASDRVVADGMPAVWLSGLLGPRLKARVTGSDLTPALLKVCGERGLSVFAIGGAPGVAETALRRMQAEHPGLVIAGTLSPPMSSFEEMDVASIGERVRQASPHLVLVAMGMGKQERLMHWLKDHTEVPLMMGVGGSLDFLAGVQTRAPRWVQRLGLEWVWRTATDPGRFVRRYTRDGVWLLGALTRLAWHRASAAFARPARPAAEDAATGTPGVLRLPRIDSEAAQLAFLDQARTQTWNVLDLGTHVWFNSLELGALAALEARIPGLADAVDVRFSTALSQRLLRDAGLLSNV